MDQSVGVSVVHQVLACDTIHFLEHPLDRATAAAACHLEQSSQLDVRENVVKKNLTNCDVELVVVLRHRASLSRQTIRVSDTLKAGTRIEDDI